VLLPVSTPHAQDNAFVFAIQPIQNEFDTKKAFQPLAEYLSRVIGQPIRVQTYPNFIAYWSATLKGDAYDLVLDAAHFTDYRVQRQRFEVLAKQPAALSFSLIVRDDALVLDPLELVGKKIATLGPPSVGAARLEAMYPNPSRQPIVVEASDSTAAVAMLRKKQVDGAMVPTVLVSAQMAGGGGLSVVSTTPQIPAPGISAGPRVPGPVKEKIRIALTDAGKTDEGRKMLQKINFTEFEPANNNTYRGQSVILRDTWGY
jgi:phosphonate transport system substrate-binding protein